MVNNMADPLAKGYNVVIQRKVGDVNTPIYPFTKTANVKDSAGDNLDTIIAKLATITYVDGKHYVPENETTASDLRFLRNDNTWQTIQSASTSQQGVVQLSDSLTTDDSTLAATAKAAKSLKDAIDAIESEVTGDYVKKSQLGVASVTGGDTGVATLDTDGKVPSSQLPSYVDDVIEGYYDETAGKFYSDAEKTKEITPEANKIYVDLTTNKTYRWSGSTYVVISETLALGETHSTAYYGDLGKIAYDHSQSAHARTDATKVESSEDNGYIQVWTKDATEASKVLVYTHPQAEGFSTTNPHGTTAEDVGLGNVDNKSSETIRSEITSTNVTTALGYTPQNAATVATASNSGVMSANQAAKLAGCEEIAVSATEPTFASGQGVWFDIISTDA